MEPLRNYFSSFARGRPFAIETQVRPRRGGARGGGLLEVKGRRDKDANLGEFSAIQNRSR